MSKSKAFNGIFIIKRWKQYIFWIIDLAVFRSEAHDSEQKQNDHTCCEHSNKECKYFDNMGIFSTGPYPWHSMFLKIKKYILFVLLYYLFIINSKEHLFKEEKV